MIQQDSRRIALIVVCLLVICGPVTFAGWLRLEVHPEVDLGTIDAGSFVDVTPPVFDPLQSSGDVSIQLSDGCPGSEGILQVRLWSASPNVDITRFMWRGGVQQVYTAFPGLREWMDVASVSGTDWHHIFVMSYRYDPTENDRQGDYRVRLQFRLQHYVYEEGERELDETIFHGVRLSWNALSWIILYIPDTDMEVYLGTITSTLFDLATGAWTPLTSTPKSAWAITNVGFTLTVTAASTGPMPADLARFQMIGGDLTTFTSLDAVRTLASHVGSTLYGITNIQYRYVPCWADAPGAYAVRVTYTVTAP